MGSKIVRLEIVIRDGKVTVEDKDTHDRVLLTAAQVREIASKL